MRVVATLHCNLSHHVEVNELVWADFYFVAPEPYQAGGREGCHGDRLGAFSDFNDHRGYSRMRLLPNLWSAN